ncbi:hypothetical protein BX666DRAFT_1671725 [Dichotomocladium elegans]|nr:hypothetical protein BX666DRAFT_1671725 [Dichotomocladium elegans]
MIDVVINGNSYKLSTCFWHTLFFAGFWVLCCAARFTPPELDKAPFVSMLGLRSLIFSSFTFTINCKCRLILTLA